MKLKFAFSLMAAACALGAAAQGGYQDGVDYYNADRFEQAKIILNNTLNESSTNKGLAYYYLGAIDLREGNAAQAKQNFDKGIQADPAVGFNYVGLGQIALAAGDKKTAENYFSDALKMDKKDPSVNTAIARAYFTVNPTLYEKEVDKYIQKALKDSKNMAADVYMLQGDMAKGENRIGDAAGLYEAAITYDEKAGRINPEGYVKYANVYIKSNSTFAINKLLELNQKLPNSALAQRELAEKYYDAELYSKAAQVYKEYMNNPNHFQQDEQRYSQLLYFDNKNEESLALAKGVLQKDPSNHYMYRMVMLNDAALENWVEAEEYGARLFNAGDVQLTTTDYRTYGEALEKNGKFDQAVKIYEQGYNANPEKNKEMLATISALYNDLATSGELDEAGLQNYKKAVEYQQRYIDLGDYTLQDVFTLANRYRNLGIALPEGSDERQAAAQKGIDYIDLALESAATPAPLLRNRAVLLQVRDGSTPTEELANTYIKMVEIYDQDPDNKINNADAYKSAYGILANYYNSIGDKDTARQYFRNLYEVAPDTPGLEKLLETY